VEEARGLVEGGGLEPDTKSPIAIIIAPIMIRGTPEYRKVVLGELVVEFTVAFALNTAGADAL